ncbi:MAG: 5-oxoprolinase/urea amidolyase family protein [Rhodospirillaceae bacterium]
MAKSLQVLPAGEDAFLIELDSLEATLALFAGLKAAAPAGVIDLIPAARTLMVRFDPQLTDGVRLADVIARIDLASPPARRGQTHEIPVSYDGADLQDVADHLRCAVGEVIRRHTAATYMVAFAGFAPGFAYLTCDDPTLDVPRRKSPRVRVPAGSVALGGRFAGIYPTDSPGGWQLIGRTPIAMWDPARARPALFAPGDRVRFRDAGKAAVVSEPLRSKSKPTAQGLLVTRADRPALFQDLGRAGHADQGVGESGAADRTSLIAANLCAGNPRGAAALEVTYGGFALKADRRVTLAVTGAPTPLAIHTSDGRRLWAPFARPVTLEAGDEIALETPSSGMRSYLALRGGFRIQTILGSAATDTLGKIGPAPVREGDRLVPEEQATSDIDPSRPSPSRLPKPGDTVTLDIVLGPRTDWFTETGVAALFAQDWKVTAETSRAGMRLTGAVPLARRDAAELASEGTALGSLQVPHNGQPVLFLADHPLTGGYPVIGVLARHHLDLAGQIPMGAKIRFNRFREFAPFVVG